MMQRDVHPHEGLLHMLNMGCGVFDQSFALPHISPQGGDLGPGGGNCRASRAEGMHLSQLSGVVRALSRPHCGQGRRSPSIFRPGMVLA